MLSMEDHPLLSGLSFSSSITSRLAGITDGQLTHWTITGIAIPSVNEGRGQGRRKRWAYTDIVGLRIIRELLSAGLSLQMVRRILPELKQFTGVTHNLRSLAQSRLVVLGNGEVAVAMDGQSLLELFPNPGQLIISSIVINLRPALVDVQRSMRQAKMTEEIRTLQMAGAWVLEEEELAA